MSCTSCAISVHIVSFELRLMRRGRFRGRGTGSSFDDSIRMGTETSGTRNWNGNENCYTGMGEMGIKNPLVQAADR